MKRAKARLEGLNLDYIVANDVQRMGEGHTKWVLIDRQGKMKDLEGSKRDVSWHLWDAVLHGIEG